MVGDLPGRLRLPLSGEVGEQRGDMLLECFVGDGVFIFSESVARRGIS